MRKQNIPQILEILQLQKKIDYFCQYDSNEGKDKLKVLKKKLN